MTRKCLAWTLATAEARVRLNFIYLVIVIDCSRNIQLKSSFTGGPMLRCVHCDFNCLGEDHLDEHVKRRHSYAGKNGKHKCEWCEYSTDKASNMKNHRVAHGKRPHRCDVCDKAFTLLSSLTRHRRTHTDQKLYSCDVCGKAFTRFSNLTTHLRIHTGQTTVQLWRLWKGVH